MKTGAPGWCLFASQPEVWRSWGPGGLGLFCVEFAGSTWVPSSYSGFLPQSKNTPLGQKWTVSSDRVALALPGCTRLSPAGSREKLQPAAPPEQLGHIRTWSGRAASVGLAWRKPWVQIHWACADCWNFLFVCDRCNTAARGWYRISPEITAWRTKRRNKQDRPTIPDEWWMMGFPSHAWFWFLAHLLALARCIKHACSCKGQWLQRLNGDDR